MEKLTEPQKQELIQHMNANDGETFEFFAVWAQEHFGLPITADDCSRLFMNSMFR